MKLPEIKMALAAMLYYQTPDKEKGVSFEDLPSDRKTPFISLAESVLVNLDKLNLRVVPNTPIKDPEQVDSTLRNHIEAEIRDFFAEIKIWKKGAIPQEELVQRIFNMFKNL